MESAPTPVETRRAELTAREAAILEGLSSINADLRDAEQELRDLPKGDDLDVAKVRISALQALGVSLRHRDSALRRELSETRAALAALPIAVPDGPPPDESAIKAQALRHVEAVISGAIPAPEAARVAAARAYVLRDRTEIWQTEEEQYGAPPLGRDLRQGPIR
jgi:hypothetical protein